MSQLHNQVVSTWEDIERYSRCYTLKRDGKKLCREDSDRIFDAYTLYVLALDDLLTVEGTPRFSWPYKRFIQSLMSSDVKTTMQTYKYADELLLSVYHGKSKLRSYDDFKRQMVDAYPSSGALIAPLKELLGCWSSNNGDCSTLFKLHTAFCFVSRIRFLRCDDLKKIALHDYLEGEANLPSVFTEEEGGFFAEWFPDSPTLRERLYSTHVGRHGPGVVAETIGKDFVKKYSIFGFDKLTDYLDMVIGHDPVPWLRPSFKRTARVIFVPKTALKLRTICAEPCTLQWYQQGFASILDEFISSGKLSRRINLHDQSLNRQLAKEGSIDGEMVTIDLSAASDSVAFEMVREWTYNTALAPMVLACRSTHVVLPSGIVMQTRKFAPMGSALCFPFECLIFCSIVEAAITEMGGSSALSRYRVYGDDIIVERQYAQSVINRLNLNGFKVNTDKSFLHSDTNIFRESCGGEYLNGEDVTPCRLPRHFNGWSKGLTSADDIERLICLCNSTYGLLPSVRSFVLTKLLALPQYLQPLFSDDTHLIGGHIRFSERCVGVYSPTANNYHLKKRWYPDFQRSQLSTFATRRAINRDDGNDGEILLYENLREIRDRKDLRPENRSDVRSRRVGISTLTSRWV